MTSPSRRTPTSAFKKILIAADASGASGRVVDYVVEMNRGNPGVHVGLFHLELPPRMLEWGGAEDAAIEDKVSEERAQDYRDLERRVIEREKGQLQKMRANLLEGGIDVSDLIVKFKEPLDPKEIAREILKTARERDFGTVVVGRHCFSGLKRFFQHHVGEELIRTGEGLTVWVVE